MFVYEILDTAVDIVNRLTGHTVKRIGVRLPARSGDLSPLQNVENGAGGPPSLLFSEC